MLVINKLDQLRGVYCTVPHPKRNRKTNYWTNPIKKVSNSTKYN
jgi:hypothetical protein